MENNRAIKCTVKRSGSFATRYETVKLKVNENYLGNHEFGDRPGSLLNMRPEKKQSKPCLYFSNSDSI